MRRIAIRIGLFCIGVVGPICFFLAITPLTDSGVYKSVFRTSATIETSIREGVEAICPPGDNASSGWADLGNGLYWNFDDGCDAWNQAKMDSGGGTYRLVINNNSTGSKSPAVCTKFDRRRPGLSGLSPDQQIATATQFVRDVNAMLRLCGSPNVLQGAN